MTTTVTAVTLNTIAASSYEVLSSSVGLIAIALLLILLIQQELGRAFGAQSGRTWVRTFRRATVPLLLAFSVIMALRFAQLLLHGS
ncbi:MAG: hypothetical protein M3021_06795 [Actinomycetota bacterium]|nr:hypothetical protein [Actinomycetota bacterium]